jgi:acylphosphatase
MRAHVSVYGAVQGVGFRFFVRQAARRAQLSGWVRNRTDGSVELEVDGPDADVDAFLQTVQHGPPLARVQRVETLPPGSDPLPSPFEIRH